MIDVGEELITEIDQADVCLEKMHIAAAFEDMTPTVTEPAPISGRIVGSDSSNGSTTDSLNAEGSRPPSPLIMTME